MSSSHLSRKELKHDAVATALEQPVEYVASHKTLMMRVAIGVVAVIVIVGGYMLYSNQQATAREEALRDARRVLTATIGTQAKPPAKSFPTETDKQKAEVEAFTKLADKYPGTTEGSIALNYLAGIRIDEGDIDAAAAIYRQLVDKAPAEFKDPAKLSLAQILWSQGKNDEAKAMIQGIIDHPGMFVSSGQAKLTMARLLMENNPEEARKVLESIDDNAGSTARSAAVEMLGRLNQKAN